MTTKDQRIRGFDGLRALAFLMVFVSHKMPTVRTDAVGTAGVWLFFVLSGFLITRILARFRERIETGSESVSGGLSAFYLSRTARIMPVYYAFLAVLSVLSQLGHIELGEKGRQLSYWLSSPTSTSSGTAGRPTSDTSGAWPSRSSSTLPSRLWCSLSHADVSPRSAWA